MENKNLEMIKELEKKSFIKQSDFLKKKRESERKENNNKKTKEPSKNLFPKLQKSEKEIAMDFAMQVHRRFSDIVKATILFGSQAKNTQGPGSDIDVIVIVDDASIKWDLELTAWYREELAKIVGKIKTMQELHINTVKLTTWWQDLMYGDPVVINILRYGEVLIDIGGFFNPLKALLLQGKINSTPEAVYAALQRAPMHLARSKSSELNAIEGIYWAMVDSAQAALMTAGKMPPSPEHIPDLLEETFVDNGMLRQENVRLMREIFSMHKAILHEELRLVKGSDIEIWQSNAEKFMLEMTRIIDYLLKSKTN